MEQVVIFNDITRSVVDVLERLKHDKKYKVIAYHNSQKKVRVKGLNDITIDDSIDNSESDYVEFMLKQCIENNVKIFFVLKHRAWIMKQEEKFRDIGVNLICESLETLNTVQSKRKTYECLRKSSLLRQYIPWYAKCSNGIDMTELLVNRRGSNNMVIKLDSNGNKQSYREIDDSRVDFDTLKEDRINKINTTEAVHIVATAEDVNDLILMDKLDGPVLKARCIKDKDGKLNVTWSKKSDVEYKTIYDICENITNVLNIKFACTIHFMHKTEAGKEQLKILGVALGDVYTSAVIRHLLKDFA